MWNLQQLSSRPGIEVEIIQTGECYACAQGESLLRGMLKLGRKGIPAGCINGGCGVCKVRVLEGEVRTLGPISRNHVSAEEEQQGYVLACRVAPVSRVRLHVCQKLGKPFSRPASALRPSPHHPDAIVRLSTIVPV